MQEQELFEIPRVERILKPKDHVGKSIVGTITKIERKLRQSHKGKPYQEYTFHVEINEEGKKVKAVANYIYETRMVNCTEAWGGSVIDWIGRRVKLYAAKDGEYSHWELSPAVE